MMNLWLKRMAYVALGFSLGSCANDTLNMQMTLGFSNSAGSQKLLTRINEALSSGETLGMRVIYTYPSRNRNNVQVSKVQPKSAEPIPENPQNAANTPRWETAKAFGVPYTGGTITLTGLPFGFANVDIIIEVLQRAAADQWYVIGWHCLQPAQGVVLTPERLKAFNNARLELTWGRSCGRCSDFEDDFDEPDTLDDVCNDGR